MMADWCRKFIDKLMIMNKKLSEFFNDFEFPLELVPLIFLLVLILLVFLFKT